MPLQASTPTDREVRVVRRFNAPRQLVFDCHAKPDLVQRWLTGPDGWSMPECEIDFRVGGTYRYVWRNDADGVSFSSSGVHKDITAPERIVTTERMDLSGIGVQLPEGPEGEALNKLVLSEADGRTTLTLTMLYANKEARDGALGSGMTDGMETSYQRLDALFANVG